ncbi:MAG: hypothetical protein JNJ54_00525 [Myxococcaceae bacterium]|nr:hypothetical protein [Myxococcaceae bacterium]
MIRALLTGLIVLLAGCGRRGSLYDAAIVPLPLVATSKAVVQVVPQTRRAVVVTPGETPAMLLVTPGARAAVKVPGRDALAILSGTARAPRLDLLDVEAREVTTVDMPGAFDRVTFSPEGAFGVLSWDAVRSAGLAARNLNEVGLLNVAAQTVSRVQLDTEGLAPRFVQFGPPVGGRRLVAVALDRGVALFDALRPEVPARRIALRPAGSTVDAAVVELLFSRDTRWLFVRTLGVDDVVVIELGAEVGAPVSASINFVAGGTGLADLELAPEAAGDAVLATYSVSGEALLLDARGIQDNVKRLQLPASLPSLATLAPGRVLLWSPASRSAVVWDVLDGRSGVTTLSGVPDRAFVLPQLGRAVLTFPSVESGASALDMVSVTDEPNRLRVRAQTIQLARKPSAVTLSADQESLFIAVPQGTQPAVVTVELRSMGLAEVLLDAPVTGLLHLPSEGQVVADHGSPFGDLSFLPVGATERRSVRRVADFALSGDLDRPEDGR